VAIGLRTKGIWLAREKRRRKRHFAGSVAAITISFSSALVLLMELVIVIGHASASALRDATGAVPGDRDPTQGAALAVTREQVANPSDVHVRNIERTQLSKFG